MRDLRDKVALVTGASRGIGRETALALARAGCHVVVTATSKASLTETAGDIEKLGRRSQPIVADLSKRSVAEAMCHQALEAFGRVDILVNNAATRVSGRFEAISLDDWERMLAVNLWPHIYAARVLLPQMVSRGEGHIVHLSSLAGLWAPGLMLPYATTKFAIVGFAEALAAQVRSAGIGVTIVCPAFVKTHVFDSYRVVGSGEAQASVSRARDWIRSHYVMKPERVGMKIVQAIRRNRFLLLTHPESRLVLWGRALFPGLFARLNSWVTDRVLPR